MQWIYHPDGGRTLVDDEGVVALYEGSFIGSLGGIEWAENQERNEEN